MRSRCVRGVAHLTLPCRKASLPVYETIGLMLRRSSGRMSCRSAATTSTVPFPSFHRNALRLLQGSLAKSQQRAKSPSPDDAHGTSCLDEHVHACMRYSSEGALDVTALAHALSNVEESMRSRVTATVLHNVPTPLLLAHAQQVWDLIHHASMLREPHVPGNALLCKLARHGDAWDTVSALVQQVSALHGDAPAPSSRWRWWAPTVQALIRASPDTQTALRMLQLCAQTSTFNAWLTTLVTLQQQHPSHDSASSASQGKRDGDGGSLWQRVRATFVGKPSPSTASRTLIPDRKSAVTWAIETADTMNVKPNSHTLTLLWRACDSVLDTIAVEQWYMAHAGRAAVTEPLVLAKVQALLRLGQVADALAYFGAVSARVGSQAHSAMLRLTPHVAAALLPKTNAAPTLPPLQGIGGSLAARLWAQTLALHRTPSHRAAVAVLQCAMGPPQEPADAVDGTGPETAQQAWSVWRVLHQCRRSRASSSRLAAHLCAALVRSGAPAADVNRAAALVLSLRHSGAANGAGPMGLGRASPSAAVRHVCSAAVSGGRGDIALAAIHACGVRGYFKQRHVPWLRRLVAPLLRQRPDSVSVAQQMVQRVTATREPVVGGKGAAVSLAQAWLHVVQSVSMDATSEEAPQGSDEVEATVSPVDAFVAQVQSLCRDDRADASNAASCSFFDVVVQSTQ